MQESVKDNISKLSKAIGQIIKQHRIAQDKSVYKISAETCMRKSTWLNVESGVDIRLSTLWKVAEGLDVDIVDLIKELKQKLGSDFTLSDFD